MARTVVGYEGKGRWRRTLYRDDGPARGRTGGSGGSDALSRLGAQVVPSRFLTGDSATTAERGGHGAIERRQATDAQRAAWAAEREAAAADVVRTHALSPEEIARRSRAGAALQAASRARGAARAGFTPGATKPYLAARQPAPVTAPPSLEEGSMAGAANATPEIITPCGDCLHAPVCSIRQRVSPELATIEVPHPALRIASITIECEFFRPESPVDVARRLSPVDRLEQAPRQDAPVVAAGRMPTYMRRAVDAMGVTNGDRTAAAARLGQGRQSLDSLLSKIRSLHDGELTPAERALIAPRRAGQA